MPFYVDTYRVTEEFESLINSKCDPYVATLLLNQIKKGVIQTSCAPSQFKTLKHGINNLDRKLYRATKTVEQYLKDVSNSIRKSGKESNRKISLESFIINITLLSGDNVDEVQMRKLFIDFLYNVPPLICKSPITIKVYSSPFIEKINQELLLNIYLPTYKTILKALHYAYSYVAERKNFGIYRIPKLQYCMCVGSYMRKCLIDCISKALDLPLYVVERELGELDITEYPFDSKTTNALYYLLSKSSREISYLELLEEVNSKYNTNALWSAASISTEILEDTTNIFNTAVDKYKDRFEIVYMEKDLFPSILNDYTSVINIDASKISRIWELEELIELAYKLGSLQGCKDKRNKRRLIKVNLTNYPYRVDSEVRLLKEIDRGMNERYNGSFCLSVSYNKENVEEVVSVRAGRKRKPKRVGKKRGTKEIRKMGRLGGKKI